jgi:hypothetical protein
MFVLKLQKLLQTKNKEVRGNRASLLYYIENVKYYIENKIGLDKTDKDLYNILACIRLHCLK